MLSFIGLVIMVIICIFLFGKTDDYRLPYYGDHSFIRDVLRRCMWDENSELNSSTTTLSTADEREKFIRNVWEKYQYPWPQDWMSRKV